jgi:hypothetical protein
MDNSEKEYVWSIQCIVLPRLGTIQLFIQYNGIPTTSMTEVFWDSCQRLLLDTESKDASMLGECPYPISFVLPLLSHGIFKSLLQCVHAMSFTFADNSCILQGTVNGHLIQEFISKHLVVVDKALYQPTNITLPLWYCNNCKEPIDPSLIALDSSNMNNTWSVRQLPSRNWQDLVDCWSCHVNHHDDLCKQVASARFAHPAPGIIYSSIDEWIISLDIDHIPVDLQEFDCKKCRNPLGKIVWNNSDPVLYLQKYQVDLYPETKDPFHWMLLLEQIQDRMHNDACYRFLLTCKDDNNILLWIINQDLYVINHEIPDVYANFDTSVTLSKGLQLAFKLISKAESEHLKHAKTQSIRTDIIQLLNPIQLDNYRKSLLSIYEKSPMKKIHGPLLGNDYIEYHLVTITC